MKRRKHRFFVCISNDGLEASLETRKIYVGAPNPDAEMHDLISIIDESGEAYLYSRTFFQPIVLPQALQDAVFAAA